LLRSGTILKVGELESDGGRRKEVLTLNQDAAYFIGVDLEGHCIRFALANLVGDVRYRWEEEIEPDSSLDVNKLVDGIERVAGTLSGPQSSRLLALGISYPGLMDRDGRLTAVNLGWRHFPLLAEFEKVRSARGFDALPVFIEPDRHSCVRAEQWLGRAQNHQNGVYASSDRGIGVGLFLDGRVVEGWRDMAGELGHLTIDASAPDLCNCGKKGCLEAIATSHNIVRQYLEQTGAAGGTAPTVRFAEILERARSGEPAAVAVVTRVCRAWGLALSHVVNLLNPEIIILGGDLVSAEDLFLPRIREELFRHCLPELVDGLELTVSSLGLDIRLKAAAALAFRKSLEDPALLEKMCSPVLVSRRPAADGKDAVLVGDLAELE
jgi:predicted NBD/HSP70 family sugar kinase